MDCYVADGYWDIGYTDSDICAIVPTGSPGGGGTVAKAPDPIRPNRRAQVRESLASEVDRAQGVVEPVIAAPKPRKKTVKAPVTLPLVTNVDGLSIVREIEARVQASIDAAAVAQAEAMALEMALMAEDESEVEMLLLAM